MSCPVYPIAIARNRISRIGIAAIIACYGSRPHDDAPSQSSDPPPPPRFDLIVSDQRLEWVWISEMGQGETLPAHWAAATQSGLRLHLITTTVWADQLSAAGRASLERRIKALTRLLADRPSPLLEPLPLLPHPGDPARLQSRIRWYQLPEMTGVSFLSRLENPTQEYPKEELIWSFQAVSHDSQWLLLAQLPISSPSADRAAGTIAESSRLDSLTTGETSPDIAVLEQLVAKLGLTETPGAVAPPR